MTYGLKNTIYDWRAGNANGRTQTYKRKKMKDRTHPSSHQGAVGLVTPAWLDLAWPGLTWGVVSLRDSRLFSFVVFFSFSLFTERVYLYFFPCFSAIGEGRTAFLDATSHLTERSGPFVRRSVPCYFWTPKNAFFEGENVIVNNGAHFMYLGDLHLFFPFLTKRDFFSRGWFFSPEGED